MSISHGSAPRFPATAGSAVARSASAWRHTPQSTVTVQVTVTLQMLGGLVCLGLLSTAFGPSRHYSPSFANCPRRAAGWMSGGRWFTPPEGGRRVSALRESTVRTGLVHGIDDRGGTAERRLSA